MSNIYVESTNVYVRQSLMMTQSLVIKEAEGYGLIGYFGNVDHVIFDDAFFAIAICEEDEEEQYNPFILFYKRTYDQTTKEFGYAQIDSDRTVPDILKKYFDDLDAEYKKHSKYSNSCISDMKYHQLFEDLLNMLHPSYTDMPYRGSEDDWVESLINSDYYQETFSDDEPDQSLLEDESWLEEQLVTMIVSELEGELK